MNTYESENFRYVPGDIYPSLEPKEGSTTTISRVLLMPLHDQVHVPTSQKGEDVYTIRTAPPIDGGKESTLQGLDGITLRTLLRRHTELPVGEISEIIELEERLGREFPEYREAS